MNNAFEIRAIWVEPCYVRIRSPLPNCIFISILILLSKISTPKVQTYVFSLIVRFVNYLTCMERLEFSLMIKWVLKSPKHMDVRKQKPNF